MHVEFGDSLFEIKYFSLGEKRCCRRAMLLAKIRTTTEGESDSVSSYIPVGRARIFVLTVICCEAAEEAKAHGG
jgi:hypothetical protein